MASAFPIRPTGFWEVLENRASCRDFAAEKVSNEDITALLGAAKSAPSAGNLNAWRVFVVEGKSLLGQLAEFAGGQDFIKTSSTVLVFCAEHDLSVAKYGKRGSPGSKVASSRLYKTLPPFISCTLVLSCCPRPSSLHRSAPLFDPGCHGCLQLRAACM